MLAMFISSLPFLSGYQSILFGVNYLPENHDGFFNPYLFLWVTPIQVVFFAPPVGLGEAFVDSVLLVFHDLTFKADLLLN